MMAILQRGGRSAQLIVLLTLTLLLAACGTSTPTPTVHNDFPPRPTDVPAATTPTVPATAAASVPTSTATAPSPSPRAATPIAATSAVTPTIVAATPMGTPGRVGATLGTRFSLRYGQTALVAPDGLEVTFQRVLEDSRCPENVNCVWSGQLIIEVALARGGRSLGTLRLNTIDAIRNKDRALVERYNLALLGARPAPVLGRPATGSALVTPVATADYVVDLLVTELPSGIAPADQAALDQRVQVGYEQTATFAAEGLTVRFLAVVSEFRCPNSSRVACATSGTATIQFQATHGTTTRILTLTLPGLTSDTTTLNPGQPLEATRATFDGYRIQLISLEPQPDFDGKPEVHSYTAMIIVSKP